MTRRENDKIDVTYTLRAANGTKIPTYGTENIIVELGMGVQMRHKFVKADVNEAIVGVDFIINHGLIINMYDGTIIHGKTGRKIAIENEIPCKIYAISELHCEEAERLLEKHKNLLYVPGEKLPPPPDVGIEHEIIIGKNKRLPAYRARRLNARMYDKAYAHFQDLLAKGVAVESNAAVSSPLHIVPKKGGSEFRFVGDYRELNMSTQPSRYGPPFVADAMNSLGGKKYFSVLDLKNAFEHIPVKKEHQDLTSIITPFGLYKFVRMPYGLCNASATFQRYMDHILRGLSRKNDDGSKTPIQVFCFIDDILIASEDRETHVKDLDAVMTRLEENNMKISAHKCHFFQKEVEFLGYRLTADGVLPTKDKCQAIEEYEPPKTLKGIKSFVGLVHFYHKHVKDLARIMKPMHELLRGYKKTHGGKKVDWSCPVLKKSFEETKKALINTTHLAYPSRTAEIALFCDASDKGIGAVLQQRESGEEDWQPIGFFSAVPTRREACNTTFFLELLAIFRALKYFQYMIIGNDFKIYSDNMAVCNALKNPKQRDNPREVRMLSYINSWNQEILHVSGKNNPIADTLSRPAAVCNQIIPDILTREELIREQEKCQEIKNYRNNQEMGLQLKKRNGIWCNIYQNIMRPFVPKPLRYKIFVGLHNLGHTGIKRTQALIKERYVWPMMNSMIKQWTKECGHCQANKITRHNRPEVAPIQVKNPGKFKHLSMDIVGPLYPSEGHRYILTMVDRFSGWIEAIPLNSISVEKVLDALINNWICRYGLPITITTDRGGQFLSSAFKDVMQTFGITHNMTCAYTPSSNGKIERTHRCIKAALRGGEPSEWKQRLGFALLSMRASYSEAIKTCPAQIVFGSPICLPGELVNDEISQGQEPWKYGNRLQKAMAKVNFRHQQFPKKPGYEDPNLRKCEYVYVRDYHRPHGLAPVYNGPYRVVKRYDKYFRLDLGNKLDSVAIHRLKTAYNPQNHKNPRNIEDDTMSNADSEEEQYNSPQHVSHNNQRMMPPNMRPPPPNMRPPPQSRPPTTTQVGARSKAAGTNIPVRESQINQRSKTINIPESRQPHTSRQTINWRPNREALRQSYVTKAGRKINPPKRFQ